MSWDNLNLHNDEAQAKLNQAEAKQRAIDTAKAYHRCFKTEAGQKVLADLTNSFIMNNKTELNAPNITYEAGYHNGEAGVVKAILAQIQRAEIL